VDGPAIDDVERAQLMVLAIEAESKDMNAAEHLRRLELTSRSLAAHAGLDDRTAAEIGWAAMLHDIGKLRVPDEVLLKPDPLSPEEWAIVHLHPIWSEEALTGSENLALAREVARSHHENWDGTGYPDGRYGDRIPVAARIVRITDAFDAMTNPRPYQRPVSIEAALEELAANAGHDFDPELVRLFGDLIRRNSALRAQLRSARH
jgi:putative two-component system response regulator